MRHLLRLALASAWNRRATLGLTVMAIALSVAMLLGVERARSAARKGFAQSVSGTDLVVGARTSPVQLMLYAVFRLGEGPTTSAGVPCPARRSRGANRRDSGTAQATAGLAATPRRVQRGINEFAAEPLLAVLPGVALDQLWQVVGVVERTLLAVSALIVVVGLAGMVAVVLASLNERRRELAILRSVGAGPRHIAALLVVESVVATVAPGSFVLP